MARVRTLAAATAAACTLLAGERVAAAGNCSALPNPIVIESGDTQEPLLKTLGQKLRNSASAPMTVAYFLAGSCTLIDDMYNARKLTVNLSYIPSTAEDPTWTPAKPSPTCTMDVVGGMPVDVAISATFVSSCTQAAPPSPLGLVQGPIQSYAFIVPKASTQQIITAEEAYFTFGFGATGQVNPWTDELYMFIRPATKSTILTIAAAIGVPAAKWKGQRKNASAEVLNNVALSTNPDKTIGIIGSEVYDANRGEVTELAYRAYGQKHGFLPDSSVASFDKKNLRDGHYTMWAPTVYITAVDGTNTPTGANAKTFIDLVLGNPTPSVTDVDGLAAVVSKGLVPDCAMKVKRASEGADLSLYSPAQPCGCFYEASVPQGTSACTKCTDTTPCGTGQCRHGYCEAK
jgi:hypothetical protein